MFGIFRKKSIRKKLSEGNKLFTRCHYCGQHIIIDVPDSVENKDEYRKHELFSCNSCVPENSAIRNDIDEPYLTDVSNRL